MTRLNQKWLKFLGAIAVGTILVLTIDGLQASPTLANSTTVATEVNSAKSIYFSLFEAIVLGMVQGLTEFIPISSTAHLKVVPVLLGWGDPGVTVTAVIQLGSIAAVLWYYREKITKLISGAFKAIQESDYQSQDFRISLGIFAGTFPIAIVGLLLKASGIYTDDSPIRSMAAIAVASIVMASLLALAEKVGSRKRDFNSLRTKDGILMGLAQTLALIPGVSRSGSTITAGLFMTLERSTAGDFSFLLGIPAITLGGIVELKDAFEGEISGQEWLILIVAVISATIFSYLAIAWLINYLKNHNTWIFIWYRLGFGLLILSLIALGMKF